MTPNASITPPVEPFRQWLGGDRLETALKRAEDNVRNAPSNPSARWLLLELLCIQGSWTRALKQLQTWATLSTESDGAAQTIRGLIRAEHQRNDVFSGQQLPVPVVDLASWMADLAQAIGLNAQGDHARADVVRTKALNLAPDIAGRSNLGAFEWITDSDTRLGPVCEVIAQGSYRWVGFGDLRAIHIAPPERLLDLVWTKAQIVLFDDTSLQVFLPTRYPLPGLEVGAQAGQAPTHGLTDDCLLSRKTTWLDVGETGVFASGQKIWTTNQIDWPLLDIRDCTFNPSGALTADAEQP